MVAREWRESLGTRDALNISSVAKKTTVQITDFMFIDVSGKTPLD